ncbi:MAG: type II toxin-antitoxin system mRNA interferase toxin, RelE/StbE family [Candidatus Peregrinibacteria bacterium]|nr:type II toxin-antitoxin system mRNA interferase toxin, RelE/StbE family [Candidatus Peregrinibacteria bacterium]MDZ4244666.1 type II toxin-antitoxin system mRNA interferase toxin, RelE/StbE family [Candidatus Gracilibacteria bacterium]
MQLTYHPKFVKQYKKLPENIKKLLQKKGGIFMHDPFDESLKTHKLKGELMNYYSFRVNYEYRVMFKFMDNDVILFYQVGTHEVYD